jgi:ribonuclease P protein component
MARFHPTQAKIEWPLSRLRKHADYQRVYKSSRKQFAKQMSYFFALRPTPGLDDTPVSGASGETARVGLTVGKAMGKAVDRNCIKRRMREAVRRQLPLLEAPVDLVLHPKRSVLDLDFATLEREVAAVFRAVQKAAQKQIPAQAEHAKT